jgi:hypothetical protein
MDRLLEPPIGKLAGSHAAVPETGPLTKSKGRVG